ncbi:uncharacterized protein LOC105749541 isoform X1 [Sarcophilus harrisii]|uniref:uncharacterized protein LOC105749541 isoform X1 n=1 Tax=Sarcophilus harrisii TaxID=9305 RepID=UPI00062B3FA7|nr:uncharacterized protein LOC105749541 isoform X1 [Sarcophilus harrisii]XP_012398683.1 uncharacterized protein LOC105749541 isoform X1 [Sarcophilus harrisii]XP_012398684.1 uncharacterized protein LOC105749541 isoform X1 [Sarcophilus harrisii]
MFYPEIQGRLDFGESCPGGMVNFLTHPWYRRYNIHTHTPLHASVGAYFRYQEELPVSIRERKDKYLTRDELVKLMEWKLTRGKFRPRLQNLVATNPEELVKQCTAAAFSLLPNVEAAITELSQLKAVGPATASAILTAGAPETTAFMADEAVAAVPGLPRLQYTLKHYILYLDKIRACAKRLNQVDASSEWTPHQIEMCLWTWTVAQKLCPTVLPSFLGEAPKTREGAEDVRPSKKRKASIH